MLPQLLGLAILAYVGRAIYLELVASSSADHGLTVPQLPLSPLAIFDTVSDYLMPYKLPASAAPYLPMLAAAELANGIPAGLLTRIAYQESHFRPDIISGETTSPAGAVGIMQIVPRWHPGVNPRDPAAAIPYAGAFLKRMFVQFGDWRLALMAYNWGPGNVQKYLAGASSPPLETQNYVAQITQDVQIA